MSQEDKELLLQDLCCRLPYGVNVDIKYSKLNGSSLRLRVCSEGMLPLNTDLLGLFQEEEIYLKPYLRPMSSMTEEEYKEYDRATDLDVADSSETLRENLKAKSRVRVSKWYHGTDWLNVHHFDYRGLIEMGLALEAPNDMYN